MISPVEYKVNIFLFFWLIFPFPTVDSSIAASSVSSLLLILGSSISKGNPPLKITWLRNVDTAYDVLTPNLLNIYSDCSLTSGSILMRVNSVLLFA